MKPSRADYTFNNTKICQIMPKRIELDRVLINLYMLLKYDGGKRPVSKTRLGEIDIDWIVEQLINKHGQKLKGFADYPDVVYDWLYSDLLDIVFRGIPDKEKLAAPLPLHLNAYKLRNAKQATDYRGAEHLYSMLHAGDPALIRKLAAFLGQGMDVDKNRYDEKTELDLDTLTIVRMVDNDNLAESASGRGETLDPPLCSGQARLLCDDLRHLLAYEHSIPRAVLIGYIRTIMGLHLGLYLLRLFSQLSGWVRENQAHSSCLNCPVKPSAEKNPFHRCPYAFQGEPRTANSVPEIIVDMGEDYTTHMAQIAQDNCARHYASTNEYIRAVLLVNQLFRYANSTTGKTDLRPPPGTPAEALNILQNPKPKFDLYFDKLIDDLFANDNEEEAERAEAQAIRSMEGLSPLEKFVELVALNRTQYYRKYLVEQLDSVLMKNSDTCLLRQGKGSRNRRRWYIGSRLLEALVQIAVLETDNTTDNPEFYSRPILIDEFTHWLKERYGLAIVPNWSEATIQDYEAFNDNFRLLKSRLREIGFYTDLSDAYNAQKIRPRYEIKPIAGKAAAILPHQLIGISTPDGTGIIQCGALTYYPEERVVIAPGKEGQILSPKLGNLLEELMEHPNEPVARLRLIQRIWGTGYLSNSPSLDVHIHWLREVIETDPTEPRFLQTVHNEGYVLVVEQTGEA